jgi:hypothetical protein|tara:strand:- start:1947 stop:2162 length:216 start_codon:yes stop_codon:yes gene_type:complete
MIKNYNDFVTEEFNDFYDDLEISKKKLKLFTKFKKIETDDVKSSFSLPQPKKKFQPKIKNYKKIDNNKGIF